MDMLHPKKDCAFPLMDWGVSSPGLEVYTPGSVNSVYNQALVCEKVLQKQGATEMKVWSVHRKEKLGIIVKK